MALLVKISNLIKKGLIASNEEHELAISGLRFIDRTISANGLRVSEAQASHWLDYRKKLMEILAQFECSSGAVAEAKVDIITVPCKRKHSEIDKFDGLSRSVLPLHQLSANKCAAAAARSPHHRSLSELNVMSGQIVAEMCSQAQYVNHQKVIHLLLQRLNLQHVDELGVRNVNEIKVIRHLIEADRKLFIYLEAYKQLRHIGTLYDLNREIGKFFHLNTYDDLYLGPIQQHPHIQQIFGKQVENPLPVITTGDIIQYVENFLANTRQRVELDHLVEFIERQTNKKLDKMGVRIDSLSLCIAVVRDLTNSHKANLKRFKREAVSRAGKNWRASVDEMINVLNRQTRPHNIDIAQRVRYSEMSIFHFLLDIAFSCKLIVSDVDYKLIESLIDKLNTMPTIVQAFHLATCYGRFNGIVKHDCKKELETGSSDKQESNEEKCKNDEEVKSVHVRQIMEFFRSIPLIQFDVDFLCALEQRVKTFFKCEHFHHIANMSMVEFLFAHRSELRNIDCAKQNKSPNIAQPSFSRQSFKRSELRKMLTRAFEQKPNEYFTHLNLSFSRLTNDFEVKHESEGLVLNESEMKLVDMDPLQIIDSCELLEDIELATNWDVAFEPRYGPLASYLKQISQTSTSLCIMETVQGRFLRLCDDDLLPMKVNAKSLVASILWRWVTKRTSADALRALVGRQIDHMIRSSSSSSSNAADDDECLTFLLDCICYLSVSLVAFDEMAFEVFIKAYAANRFSLIEVCNGLRAKAATSTEPNAVRLLQRIAIIGGGNVGELNRFRIEEQDKKQKLVLSSPAAHQCSPQAQSIIKYVAPFSLMANSTRSSRVRDRRESTDSPFEHIQKIRVDKFGYDPSSSDNHSSFSSELRAMIGRSLTRLSSDLYNSKVHFVFELLQNCDDNEYDVAVEPSAHFRLQSDRIVLFSNELGFTHDDIECLCDIANSKKSSDCIGRKGIGFRSVFSITQCPAIHSNGYHIVFNTKKYGSMGYVLPEWIDDHDHPSLLDVSTGTTFVFPTTEHISCELTNVLQLNILLFLKKLSRIEIEWCGSGEFITTLTKEVSQNTVKLSKIVNGNVQRTEEWVVCTGEGSATAAVAIPFKLNGQLWTDADLRCDLYAFLPVRSYGLRFVVQADFELTSSRQDISLSSCKNHELLDSAKEAFLKVPQLLNYLIPIDPVQRIKHIVAHLPRPCETSMEGFAEDIIARIANEPIFPCLGEDGQCIVRPSSQTAIVKNARNIELMQKCLTPQLLNRKFHRFYLCTDDKLTEQLIDSQLAGLGIKVVNCMDLVDLLKDGYRPDNAWDWLQAIADGLIEFSISKKLLEIEKGE